MKISIISRRIAFALFALLATSTASVAAPLGYAGGTYTQDFNDLPTDVTNPSQVITGRGPHEFSVVTGATNLTGWQLANFTGSSSNTEFRSQDGSLSGSSGRGVISYGANGSTDRALGTLSTSNQISSFGLAIQNNTGQVIDSFALSYTGEQWRRGDVTTADTLAFAYGFGADLTAATTSFAALSFTEPNLGSPTNTALNGNAPANQAAVAGTVTGLTWNPGQVLVLRWNSQDLTGQDNGLGIDNLAFSAHAVPEPSTLVLAGCGIVGLVVATRRFRKR